MKKHSKKTVVGCMVIVAVLVCSIIPVFAQNLFKTIEVAYRDIKLYVDGSLITPKDASGMAVEPFIYNGTTYLPVRAVGEALGKTVEWDGDTNSVYIGESIPQEITEVTVSTAEEFLSAIGSNKRILLEAGVYNLSSVSATYINSSLVHFDSVFDGNQLRLDGVHNLTIVGIGGAKSEIIVEPRYAFVMDFQNCSNISIVNVKAGHTEGGYCAGGVFSFVNCSDIQIDKTLMYGCGTIGLNLDGTANVTVTDSSIYECTYGIMTINKSRDIRFERCIFRDNAEYTLVAITLTTGFTIDSCEFLRNKSLHSDPMFSISQSDNIVIKNSKFADNQAEKLIEPAGMKFDASNTFENNTF